MHVVLISKANIVGAYQRKLEELARLDSVRLTAVVPPSWRDSRGAAALERVYTQGYDLIVTPMALSGHFHLHFYPRLRRLLASLSPDLLHVDEEPYNLATWQAMHVAQELAIPACFFSWQNINRRYPPPFRWFELYNYRHAAHALAGSYEAASVLQAKGYDGPVSIVPQFGVDAEAFSPRADSRATPVAGFSIGYAGGLVLEKGVDLLLRAVAELGLPNLRLYIAGGGSERSLLERLALELGIGSSVRFLGRLPSTQMPEYYRSLDVLVVPSRTQRNWKEQFGRVLIEAMACGVPVLGSDSGEIPRVIGDAGLVFPEEDAMALARLLRRLVDDSSLRVELSSRGRRRVLENFTHRHVACAMHRVYQQMLN